MTRQEIETALDEGRIKARMRNGALWHLRRNGRTKLWKTRPMEFRIPVAAGLHAYAYLTEASDMVNDFVVEPRQ